MQMHEVINLYAAYEDLTLAQLEQWLSTAKTPMTPAGWWLFGQETAPDILETQRVNDLSESYKLDEDKLVIVLATVELLQKGALP